MKIKLYTRYPIVARALGLAAAFRPSARASKGILHTKNKAQYDKMNEFCDKDIDIPKLRYRKKFFDDYKDNSRKQWQMMNELLNRPKSYIRVNKLIYKNGKVHNTPTAIAENFNEYFANITSNLKNEIANRSETIFSETIFKFNSIITNLQTLILFHSESK